MTPFDSAIDEEDLKPWTIQEWFLFCPEAKHRWLASQTQELNNTPRRHGKTDIQKYADEAAERLKASFIFEPEPINLTVLI